MSDISPSRAYIRIENKDYWTRLKKSIKEHRYIYLLVLPSLVYLIIFYYLPIYGIQLAFKDYNIAKGIWGSQWVGLRHFKLLMADSDFWFAFRNTIVISLQRLAVSFPIPIILAIVLNEVREGAFKRVLQTIYTFPHFLSWLVISGIILNIFSSAGVINNFLAMLGFERQMFLAQPALFRPLLYFLANWKESGWSAIIFLATISGINPELYEAAIVDGANRWHKIIHITWPSIATTVVILFILSLGGVMDAGFDQIFVLQNPLVREVADIIDTYLYRITFDSAPDFGFSAAIGLFRSLINFILLYVSNFLVKRVVGWSLF